MPTGASSDSSIRPSVLSTIPSSFAEHNMPKEGTPRSLAFFILKLPGNTAPTTATGILKSWRTFDAPQTIDSNSSPFTLIWQQRNLSASGWSSTDTTWPTTTPLKSPATGSVPSTSRPACVNCATKSSLDKAGLTHSRNHVSLNFIVISQA